MIDPAQFSRPGDPRKSQVFISYSRRDMVFVDRLEQALTDHGFEPSIDRRDIADFEIWGGRIEVLITRADTVVFVLSPDATSSEVALKEVSFAASLDKRFAPIVCRHVADSAVPAAIARFNRIDFVDTEFEGMIKRLVRALHTDIDWIRKHTEFGEAAKRWDTAERPKPGGLMLRPPVLGEAEQWIAARPPSDPEPTEVLRAFIVASRKAFDEEMQRLKQERDAAFLIRSRFLAEFARQCNERSDFGSALAVGLEAIPNPSEPIAAAIAPEAVVELDRALRSISERCVLRGHEYPIIVVSFDPSGTRVLTASFDNTARLWDAVSGAELAIMHHDGPVQSAAFDPSGTRILTASRDGTARLWDAATGTQLAVLRGHENSILSAVFDADGRRVLTSADDGTARVWSAENGAELAVLRGHHGGVMSAAFGRSRNSVVTGSDDNSAALVDPD